MIYNPLSMLDWFAIISLKILGFIFIREIDLLFSFLVMYWVLVLVMLAS